MVRDYYQKKLKSIFEIADDESFLRLIWATNAIQNGASDAALKYLDRTSVPENAITEDISSPHSIHEWELETLANEILTIPKRKNMRRGRELVLNTANFNAILQAIKYLRKLENFEFGYGPRSESIFIELTRIANREFDWQRGYFNVPQFYRNAFIYGQGICAVYFKEKTGVTVDQLSLVGFGLYSTLIDKPIIQMGSNTRLPGIDHEGINKVVRLIAHPLMVARETALKERRNVFYTAYRPSIFRMKPCISLGTSSERIVAPIPALILERVTSGIFYDVVSGGGAIRNDYGKRFEEYCLSYFRAMLPAMEWLGETRYKSNEFDTPDIMCSIGQALHLVVECKATRMSYAAKFGNDPLNERGVEDLVKAVFQLWRFFSHCRRGLAPHAIHRDATAAVLTLDNWLIMAELLRERILSAARKMAADKDPLILEIDCRQVAFIAIADLEHTLSRASGESFLNLVRASASDKYACWHLSSVYKEIKGEIVPTRNYPFLKEVGRVLPWWDKLEKMQKERS